jgi:hypothetical protein
MSNENILIVAVRGEENNYNNIIGRDKEHSM